MLTPLLPRGASLAALEIFDETGSGLRLAASSTAHITAGGFSAAHRAHAPRLSAEENHAHFGASNNPAGHGHNYQVEIETPGPISAPPPPWADLDHRNLSVDIPEFHGRNAVTETVAELIARRVPSAARVRVWESPELFAVYETAPARYQLGRRDRLHAAHQLYDPAVSPAANRRRYGRCAAPAPHGHAYTAYVVVSGPLDPPTETVYDLAALDAAAGPLFRSIDSRGMPHALPELADAPETTEQFAAALWRRLDGALGPALIELVLYETLDARTQVKRGLDG